jgi:hypothetical protein
MRTSAAALLAPLLASHLVACEPTPPTDDFASVLPDERVLVNLPVDVDAAARTGEWSQYYLFTAQVTDDVNGIVGFVLYLVDTITEYPASSSSEDTAVWGPFADSLDPAETQLWVTHDVETDAWTWGFDQRAKNDEAAVWVTVVAGEVDPGATEEASRGRFAVDWTTMSTLDPNVGAVGMFYSEYDIATTGVTASAAFDAVGFAGGEPVDALYLYEQVESGEGAMDLAYLADVNPGSGTGAEEVFVVRSRWQPTGAGRADATVSGGDLGSVVGTASECWDTSFQSAYYIDNYTPIEQGDASACVFAEAEYSDEL